MFSCVPHICQVKVVSAPLFCLYSTAVFTDQPRALQLFSAAVSPHTKRCATWLATPVRTGASIQRFAHSTVASLNASSHRITTYDSSCRCRPACMSVRSTFVYWCRDTAIANSIGSPLTLTLMKFVLLSHDDPADACMHFKFELRLQLPTKNTGSLTASRLNLINSVSHL